MLLQTNSYVVPKEKRAEHARLVRKFRQTLGRLGCEQFDVFEQVGPNWGGGETTGRFVQMMRFRDRKHQVAVQTAEKQDPAAQALIQEFCELINFGYQQQQGLFAVGYYQTVLPVAPTRMLPIEGEQTLPPTDAGEAAEVELTPEHEDAAHGEAADEAHAETPGDAEPMAADLDLGIDEGTTGMRRVDLGGDEDKLGSEDLEFEVDVTDAPNNGEEQRPPAAS
jgi:hypothetical protein